MSEEVIRLKKKIEVVEVIQEAVKENKGFYVCSRLSHPVECKIGSEAFMLSARGSVWIENRSMLAVLPNGCYVREIL